MSPPHKRDEAVTFRDKAVKMAKVGQPKRTFGAEQDEWMEEDGGNATAANNAADNTTAGNVCQGAYFTFYQTAATRFRVTLMWAVADAIKTNVKQAWVSQTNRPTLQIKEGGKIVKTLSYVQTMNEYKDKIPKKTLEDVKKAAQKLYSGNLEKTFIVIKD